jgi:hypothetical protein
MRLRPAHCIALLAAFLNVLAPVLAYAMGQPLHEAGVHAQHMHGAHHAAPVDEPIAPHCPYCLDFAAGAALGSTVPVIPAAQDGHPPLPAVAPVRVSVRPSLRLASPRGPPRAG